MYTLLVLLFIILIAGGMIWAYIYYLGEKGEKLKLIQQGICPVCKQKTIEIINQKSGGCSATAFVEFKCQNCDYTDSFNLAEGNCCKGSCKT